MRKSFSRAIFSPSIRSCPRESAPGRGGFFPGAGGKRQTFTLQFVSFLGNVKAFLLIICAAVTIGFVFQGLNLIPVLTAIENVELPLKLTSPNKKERMAHATRAATRRFRRWPQVSSAPAIRRTGAAPAIVRAIVIDPI